MELRSIELDLPDPDGAARFLTGTWGLGDAGGDTDSSYLRGSGDQPYLVGLHRADHPLVRSVTFLANAEEIEAVRLRAAQRDVAVAEVSSADPGAGAGITLSLPDGAVIRLLAGAGRVAPVAGFPDRAVRLTHVVLNAVDAEATARFAEDMLGFRVSDRTKGMVFVRCNSSHHSIAFARAGFASLNHIAFEMADMDAVMRGIGRLRDVGMVPAWGPGRHGPGANVFAYFIAPFGAVVEFSTAVEVVGEDYRTGTPEDWSWPPNRIDQWGISGKDMAALGEAERVFRFRRRPNNE
ncbi:VOC family protein [Niveispirillum sp. KHB5.9]|uniref:VOC family protein n=1 Tax=Niveispirillum sp. KHB5.9 TaxID=3400269 RepID=UPI003A865477